MPSLEGAIGAIGRANAVISVMPGRELAGNGSFFNSTTIYDGDVAMPQFGGPGPGYRGQGISPVVVRSLLVMIFSLFISGVIVLMRVATRWQRLKRLISDDILIMSAWGLSLATGLVSHFRDNRGFGNAEPTTSELAHIFLQQFILMQLFYITLAIVQISVALNYRRFTADLNRWHILSCNIVLAYIVLGTILEIVSFIFQCAPIAAFWSLTERSSQCYGSRMNMILVTYGPPLFRISADIALICIPMPTIFSLSLPRSQKCAVVGVICVTFLSVGANLRRLVLTEPAYQTSVTQYLTSTLPAVQMWSNIEVGSAIVCACAVTLRGPFVEFWKMVTSGSSSTSSPEQRKREPSCGITGAHGMDDLEAIMGERTRNGSSHSDATVSSVDTIDMIKSEQAGKWWRK